MKFSDTKDENADKYENEKEKKENVEFAAILTGKEEVPEVYTLDTALATFQSNNKNADDKNEKDEELKYSVKITDMEKVKKVSIDVGKSPSKEEDVADLYKTKNPTKKVDGKLCEGKINSTKLKGTLQGKKTKELIQKIEKGEAYVNISTEDKPKGKVRGKIEKLK